MRPSLSLPLVALMANFAYGFSSEAATSGGVGTGTFFRSRHSLPSITRPVVIIAPSSSSSSSMASVTTAFPRGGGFGTKNSKKQQKKQQLTLANTPIDTGSKCPATGAAALFGTLWGVGGVLYILMKAIKRVMPIALEPFQSGAVPLGQFHLGAYIVTCLWFAYVEGYKGFQLKFSPLVVKRSFTLIPGKNGTQWYHFLLAPFYSMGLMHATRKRKIVSWSVSLGVALIVAAVKRLPYPWRNIVDAGVVAGLTWGSLSIVAIYVQSWLTGKPPSDIDAALPEEMKKES